MSSHRGKFVVGIVVVLSLVFGTVVMAAAAKKPWPESWFSAPKTASELGITKFKQSPYLDAAVASGELPPVEERLPEDPVVIEPAHEIGKYGGRAIVNTTSNTGWGEGDLLNNVENLALMDPEVSGIFPNVAKRLEFNEDKTELTIELRKGIKWSDGHPFTAEDIYFAWKYDMANEELNPVPSTAWSPGGELMTAEMIDDYTIKFHFAVPHPLALNYLAQGDWFLTRPAHYMKQFHPAFVDRKELEKKAKEAGFDNWMQYYGYMTSTTNPDINRPTLQAYVIKEQTTDYLLAVRNPYYWKVDPEGNQLPYIDEVICRVVQDQEMETMKAATGEVNLFAKDSKTIDIPLFKKSEKEAGFKTLIWNRLHGVDVAIQPNLTHPDPKKRKVMQDFRFRKALSVAINRNEINKSVYFGKGTPRQTTVIPTSKFFEPEFANAYIEYDPEEAKRLLDEMGLKDLNGDGMRDYPDGEPFELTLEWTPMETPKGPTMELVTSYWRAVGLDIRLKQISGSLQGQRARAGLMDMTLWHADRTTDILFPVEPFWFVPMHNGWEECHWTAWSDWYRTRGKSGEEPPQEIKNLTIWWDNLRRSTSEEEQIKWGKKILQSQAENLWTIGTIGLAPHPVIIKNLGNVPEFGYWGWDNRWSMPYHPETWYLTK